MRDEQWEKYRDLNPPKGQAKLYYKDNAEYWKDGFDAGMVQAAKLFEESEGLMPIVVEETKKAYGIRLIEILVAEIRQAAVDAKVNVNLTQK